MSNAVVCITFNLAAGASVPGFLDAAEELNTVYMSKQKGFISWQQLVDGDLWADVITWETMEDAKKMMEPSDTQNAAAEKFYSFINMETCKVNLFSVERIYKN